LAQVVYSREALQDLERVVAHLLAAGSDGAPEAADSIAAAVSVLARHPRIGRRVRGPLRELVIGHGATGYLALYRYEPARSLVRILRVRHQREAGYRD